MHPTPVQLEAFDRGDIAVPDAAIIEEHLATCESCLAWLERGSSPDELVDLIRATAPRRPPRPPAPCGTTPAGYDIIEPIGRGGMGVVFKARHRALGRLVAFKQVRAGLDADARELARFHAEARAAARLSHPNIVKVFDVGEQDGLPFIAMELVEGVKLAETLWRGPLPHREAAALLESLARAVEHAHSHGIVHRDLKPANILLAEDLTPRIVDFGLVKFQGSATETEPGALLGTPRYMAPEQACGGTVGAAVDLHALGVILYECLTGRPPFQGATALEVIELYSNSGAGAAQPASAGSASGLANDLHEMPRKRPAAAICQRGRACGRSRPLLAGGTDSGTAGWTSDPTLEMDQAQASSGRTCGIGRACCRGGTLRSGASPEAPSSRDRPNRSSRA